MKLAGESHLPSYEVVGLMGFFGCLTLVTAQTARKKIRALWPRKPSHQVARSLLALGNVMINTVALAHLPLTMFYITVFTSPMIIALLAAWLLKERLDRHKVAAIVIGFVGVVIAIEP
jgi:drug/metabolite transporter (DMT)-like permease